MKKIIVFIVFGYLLISCQKKTTFNVLYPDAELVVNCIVNPDSLCKVYISKSLIPTDTINFKDIPNAETELFRNGEFAGVLNNYVESNRNPGLGYFTNPEIAINANDSLEITVSHKKFKTVFAKTFIPEKPVVNTSILSYTATEITNPYFMGYDFNATIKMTIIDDLLKEKFYSVKMFYYADKLPYPVETDTLYSDLIHFSINGDNVFKTYKFNEGYLFSNQYFSGNSTDFILNIDNTLYLKQSDTAKIYIEIKSISKDFYLYQKSLKEYYNSINNPFSEPAEVYGNINFGYGIFAGYNSVTDTFTIVIIP